MQDLPEKVSLIEAVARFLGDDRLKKEVRDPALAFRLKIAVHVLETVVREEKNEAVHDAAELARLEQLLGRESSAGELSRASMRAKITEHNAELAKRLRSSGTDAFAERARAHLKQTLTEKLSVTQPRFDTSMEIE
jgi:hypothetical protein